MANLLISILYFLIVLAALFLIWWLFRYFNKKLESKYTQFLDEKQFEEGKRKAQVVDLRESKSFDDGHILGALNLPFSTFRNFYTELRPDLPVYLYAQNNVLSMKGARFLHKKGFKKLAILNGGYQQWNGKIKKSSNK